MYTITKEFSFEAAHRLLGHPKCGRLHGHSYRVIVELQAQDLTDGMVRDYAELDIIKKFIDSGLDHRYIVSKELVSANDPYYLANPDEARVFGIQRSTAEEMAKMMYTIFKVNYPELTAVTVCETSKTSATYRFERGLR